MGFTLLGLLVDQPNRWELRWDSSRSAFPNLVFQIWFAQSSERAVVVKVGLSIRSARSQPVDANSLLIR
jgi:hypothetical protein